MRCLATLVLLLVCSRAAAQVRLEDSISPIMMAQRIAGPGITILTASLTPSNELSSGTFDVVGPKSQIGLRSGIIITNTLLDTAFNFSFGTVQSFGINNPQYAAFGGFYQRYGIYDTIASLMVDTDVHNVYNSLPTPNVRSADFPNLSQKYRCALEFDFVPQFDSVRFRYVFAHDGNSRNSCKPFNNVVLCAFISGKIDSVKRNLILVPGTNYPVCLNTINHGRDSIPNADTAYQFPFCKNIGPGVPFSEYWNEASQSPVPDSVIYAFDGWSTPLIAMGSVNPCDTYHVKIIVSSSLAPGAIATPGAGVFIETGSFNSYSGTGCPTDTTTSISPNKKPEDFALAFPNPFSSSFELKLQGSAVRSSYHVLLLSALGQQLYQGSGSLRGINYELKQLAPTLPAGLYFVSITDVKGAQQVLKVSKR